MIKFGINSADLDKTAEILGAVLNAKFIPHDSSFRGGDYFRVETDRGTMFLQMNCDPCDRQAFEPTWPSENLVLYIDGVNDKAWDKDVASLLAAHPSLVVRLP